METSYNSKPRYGLLDGLRGVAALMVIWYHIFEGFATSPVDQKFNHGYLAVDFFFILSGFVIGYAYDDRWKTMSAGEFFKRRIIRLHPMVFMGAAFGLIAFIIQGCVQWDGTHIPASRVFIAFIMSIFLIPSRPGGIGEIRGNGEMFPLNGPSWSLFFEYVGNIMYALFLRRLSTRWLSVFTFVSGIGYTAYAVFNGSGSYSMVSGWTLGGYGFLGGLLRVTFCFSTGLLLSRNSKRINIKGAFWICSSLIICLLSVPYIGGSPNWVNGLYDAVCTIIIFPIIVLMGASGTMTSRISDNICSFLGKISYPIYIIQYPIMYLFYAWLWKNGLSFTDAWPIAICIFLGLPVLAYACLTIYETPVRKWLTKQR